MVGLKILNLADNTWALFESIPGWDADSGRIEIQNNVAGSPYEGEQFVELDSTRPSTIYQLVDTVVGQNYVLSFAFAARPNTNINTDNVMGVTWGGVEIFNMAAPDFTPNWTVFTRHVTATSDLTRLTFGDLSPNAQNSYGVYLDDVSLVTKVPEPGTLGTYWDLDFSELVWPEKDGSGKARIQAPALKKSPAYAGLFIWGPVSCFWFHTPGSARQCELRHTFVTV